MTDFNIPAGTTQTVGSLSGNPDTVEGNSTAAYGAGGVRFRSRVTSMGIALP